MKMPHEINFAFFGTPELAVIVLDQLEMMGLIPEVVITAPDKPQGRGLKMTRSPVKCWVDDAGDIPFLQPEKLDAEFCATLRTYKLDLAIVVAYGKILPKSILDIPTYGILNVHPSHLPKWRGPSPVVSAILANEEKVGVTIMQLDEEMDHGPVLAGVDVIPKEWPAHAEELERRLMEQGGKMLVMVIPLWVNGRITPHIQDHAEATYCKKITKEDGLLDLTVDAYQNLLKIRAYEGWPGTYAFFHKDGKKIRVKICDAHIDGTELIIDKVIPEGKREMSYSDFLKSGAKLI